MNDKHPPIKHPSTLLATWFGLGLIPKAPGTWGSLGAIPPAIIVFHFTGLIPFIASLILLTPIAFWATAKYEKATNTHDNKQIVIDEVIGQWIALLPVFCFAGLNWILIGIAFILFRLFDIIKPWPVSHFDKNVGGANGVMLDDIVAGIIAALIITGAIYAGIS